MTKLVRVIFRANSTFEWSFPLFSVIDCHWASIGISKSRIFRLLLASESKISPAQLAGFDVCVTWHVLRGSCCATRRATCLRHFPVQGFGTREKNRKINKKNTSPTRRENSQQLSSHDPKLSTVINRWGSTSWAGNAGKSLMNQLELLIWEMSLKTAVEGATRGEMKREFDYSQHQMEERAGKITRKAIFGINFHPPSTTTPSLRFFVTNCIISASETSCQKRYLP